MKVTIVGPAYPLRGGIAHHIYWLRRELVGRGHTLQVISFSSLYPKLFFPGTSERDSSRMKLDAEGLPVIHPLNPITWLRARRLIKEFAPDLLVIEWWNTFFSPSKGSIIRLAKRAGIRSIIECHNILPHERTLVDRVLLDYSFSPVDCFITHSDKDRETLLAAFPRKSIRVAMLPMLDEFSGQSVGERDGRTILFFGLVRKYKGLDVLLRAMPKVLAQVECRLVVVGEFYDPIYKYRKIIRDCRIEPYVEIDNRYVPNEEVAEIFNRADVLVLPYIEASQSSVARIAGRNALPIIASRAGGLPQVIEEGESGLLFPPGDADALADRLIEFFSNGLGPIFANRLRTSADGASSNIADIIEEIVQKEMLK